jgi:hypothetical protein
MPRKIATSLSNTEIGRIRSNLSRANSKIGNRLQQCALGTLTDKDGNSITMSSSELKAAGLLLANTLPAQAASTIEDVTPNYVNENPQDLQAQYMDMVKDTLAQLPADERERLLRETSKQ